MGIPNPECASGISAAWSTATSRSPRLRAWRSAPASMSLAHERIGSRAPSMICMLPFCRGRDDPRANATIIG